ncbi:succinyl-diaminopimelate desuccinylase [Thermodesulfobium acidiphilum]|uniref:Succinyl-diaminopimelate desuccinylase n=1 Tax=Thermodesulfobium acidiphilum TaxID=1794699 RepID=A0A2R4W054_THEAF|nr:dipeptidase PepV [Thermodesulfobium acidiphilum]AWB10187.1 succinyl-diaminopimelate desuccinylase [Thermodesulfobium acidiphilum]
MDYLSFIGNKKAEFLEDLKKILSYPSVNQEKSEGAPFGIEVRKCLDETLNIAKRMGFKTFVVNDAVGVVEYGDSEEYVGCLAHLDVVPAGEGWDSDPFVARIDGDRIYARGAIDDKGPAMASLYSLYAIKELGVKIGKKIRLLFGTNEEEGSKDMPLYLAKEKPPIYAFSPDAEFPVVHSEKGMVFARVSWKFDQSSDGVIIEEITGGTKVNVVPNKATAILKNADEKIVFELIKKFNSERPFKWNVKYGKGMFVECIGKSSHAAHPELGLNAIMGLIEFLSKLSLNSKVKGTIDWLAAYIDGETDAKKFGIFCEDKYGRLTFNVGIVSLKDNVFSLDINYRTPVTLDYDAINEKFVKIFEKTGAKVEFLLRDRPLFYPEDHFLVKTLLEVYRKYVNSNTPPLSIGGGTYSKHIPNTVSFGPLFEDKQDMCHEANEYASISDLITCSAIYAEAMVKLSVNK